MKNWKLCRALKRHGRGWGFVFWGHSDVETRLAIVTDAKDGDTYPANPGALLRWEQLPGSAKRKLMKMPPIVRDTVVVCDCNQCGLRPEARDTGGMCRECSDAFAFDAAEHTRREGA